MMIGLMNLRSNSFLITDFQSLSHVKTNLRHLVTKSVPKQGCKYRLLSPNCLKIKV